MRKKITTTKRRWEKIVFVAFIVFCVGVLAWDYSQNGMTAAWGAIPSSEPVVVPEPKDSANNSGEDATTNEQTPATDASSAFATMRMEREQARGDELSLLETIIADESSSPATKEDAELRRLQIAADMENESSAEGILLAKGYGQTVVMAGADQATVIMDMEIEEKDAPIIAEIVDKACGCGFENVVIVKR